MAQIIDALHDLITDHWAKLLTAAAFTGLGWLVARMRAAREWKRREFFDRLNFSLNSLHDGTLLIRTLAEKPCHDVFLNRVATDRLLKLAQQTTPADPLIPIPQEDSWYFLNAVLNELSEQFASGLLRRDAGLETRATRYLIALTNECDGEIRTRKIRAMVIRRDLLQTLPGEQPRFESPTHSIRWKTLQSLKAAYATTPWRFMEAEIVL